MSRPTTIYLVTFEGSYGFGMTTETKLYQARARAEARAKMYISDVNEARTKGRRSFGIAQVLRPGSVDENGIITWEVLTDLVVARPAA